MIQILWVSGGFGCALDCAILLMVYSPFCGFVGLPGKGLLFKIVVVVLPQGFCWVCFRGFWVFVRLWSSVLPL